MPRRKLVLVGVTLLATAGVAVVLLRGSDEKRPTGVGDPLAEALGYAPASAQVVAAVDVASSSQQGRAVRDLARTFPVARFAADSLRSSVRALGLDPDQDLPKLLGGPLVLAGDDTALSAVTSTLRALQPDLPALLRGGAIAAITGRSADEVKAVVDGAVTDGRVRELPRGDAPSGTRLLALPDGSGVLAVRGADLVLARDAARVVAAIALRDRRGGMTRAQFERRLGPLAGPALLRVAAEPRVLLAPRAHGVPFVDALRGGALALRVEPAGLRLRAHLATDPRRLRAQDLPLAPGAQPPSPAPGGRPLSADVRDLAQTIHVLDAVRGRLRLPFLMGITSTLDTLDRIKGPLRTFGGIDADAALIDQLTGTTSVTAEDRGVGFRAELRDGGPLRTALKRIAAIPDVAISLAHITDLDLDKAGAEAFEVRRNGTTFLRLAVLGNTLAVTTDLNGSLGAIAARRPEQVSRPGALAFHASGLAIQDLIVRRLGLPGLARLVLGGIGDVDGSARAELTGVDLDAMLKLER